MASGAGALQDLLAGALGEGGLAVSGQTDAEKKRNEQRGKRLCRQSILLGWMVRAGSRENLEMSAPKTTMRPERRAARSFGNEGRSFAEHGHGSIMR